MLSLPDRAHAVSIDLEAAKIVAMQSEQFELHADIEQRHWWFVARRQILAAVIRAVVPPSASATIVDVGCGTGANLACLAGDYECVGIDSSSQAIRLARTRFPAIRFVHGHAPGDLSTVLARTQLVLISDVLEHVSDDFRMLSELLAAVRPGTFLLMTVPADMRLWTRHDESFGHYRRYDRGRFESIWQDLPVSVRFVSHYNSRLLPLVRAVRWWNRRHGQTSGAAGTDFRVPSRPVNRMLTSLFGGERRRLVRLAQGTSVRPYRHGVSLMALVRREEGPVELRVKPCDLADYFDPAAELVTSEA